MSEDEKASETLTHHGKPLERVSVRVVEGKGRGRSAVLLRGQSVSVGKSPDNQLQLDDMTVSRYHVDLTLRGGKIDVHDLESTNGTYIGETRVIRASVSPGTKLTIGSNWIVLSAEPGVASGDPEPPELPEFLGVVARSAVMRRIVQAIDRLARSDLIVLLHGETGTGKELLARALHDLSARRDRPFEVVDCSSLAPALIASELFGHERGAFSGADAEHVGAFERAHGGTVFLDEVGELPIDLQPVLLGILQRRRFHRVGGVRERRVNVRVIGATQRDLRIATNLGTFRADLYFRLAAARVVIPPLREHPEDIAPLARHFAYELTGDPDSQPFDRRMLAALEAHPWSGNVRELRNMVESTIGLGSRMLGGADRQADVPPEDMEAWGDVRLELPYRDARTRAMSDFERNYLRMLMEACGGNVSEAARRAGIARARFIGLLRKQGLRRF